MRRCDRGETSFVTRIGTCESAPHTDNFPTMLPAHESNLAHEMLQDQYNVDFLGRGAGVQRART
ncbi:hypothetical protein RW1_019_00640 [Rhodococcus wratislaviensis NBRC 100605]|uniref:Uncharacterized protein n=1 Tax=Rhodococcus wratislaviensis NBRC 100605 TaxID=1219028 RepID=X0Q2Q9_RHOWR|nr:hypothetical protein RW1_019_00640 [Rhodococcus wratislaviensis NBRC 100605]